jgi:DNA polymerase-3 subunit delta
MTAQELYRKLKQGDIPEVIVLCGAESFLLSQASDAVHTAIFGDAHDDFNENRFDAKTDHCQSVIDAAVTLPVFAARRLVVVKDVQLWSAAEIDVLLPYVENPLPETCLLLIAGKLDNRRKSTQYLKKRTIFVEFKPLSERDLPAYVRQLLEEDNFTITTDALQLFCTLVSNNLHEVHSELEKLKMYMGQVGVIDVAQVNSVVSRGRSENIFELGNAVGRGDVAHALRIVSCLRDAGEPPVKILFLMVGHFRRLWKVRELKSQHASDREIASQAKVPFFVMGDMMKQGRRFSRQDFLAAYDAFLETDLAMKSSGADADALLESLVLRLSNRQM